MFLYFLKVEFKQLNVRLSYNDLKLFLAIAQSLPPLTSTPSAPPTPSGNKVNSKLITELSMYNWCYYTSLHFPRRIWHICFSFIITARILLLYLFPFPLFITSICCSTVFYYFFFKSFSIDILFWHPLKTFLFILNFLVSDLVPPPDALVKQMLPLGYTKSEIRHQLFLNSNNHSSSEGDPAVREEGVEEGQGTGGKVEEVDTATGMKFTVGKIEVGIFF